MWTYFDEANQFISATSIHNVEGIEETSMKQVLESHKDMFYGATPQDSNLYISYNKDTTLMPSSCGHLPDTEHRTTTTSLLHLKSQS